VGGTTADGKAFPKEAALFFGSGGFSDVFTRPVYQDSSVNSYLHTLGSNYTGLYNKNGRGFPDVAAFGSDIAIINGGEKVRAGGTSASAPIFASIIALINDHLMSEGRPPLGFLNPWLYSERTAKGLNDVTSGSIPGCKTDGFYASAGWDPTTGLGSPNVGMLIASTELS
jgi:tripeptidyl-peptidase-1